jgi:uncharacterized protein YbbK (DUF523 family)
MALEQELAEQGLLVLSFCPEEAGGLGTPRPPAWIESGGADAVLSGAARVLTESGADVSAGFRAGAEAALLTCRAHGVRRAFLKERSPSCGVRATHVGGALVEGPGVTAALLARHGIEVRGVEGRRELPDPGSPDDDDVEAHER